MALPRQIKIGIAYDGTAKQTIAETVTETGTGAESTYTVVRGDCLWNIAKKFYGSGAKYTIIYDANIDVIESTAKAHGKKSSDNGHWIWPGETFTIPEA